MSELRRCSPEIERELHDKEARIRELETALERKNGYISRLQEHLFRVRIAVDGPLATTPPPDSEPAEGRRHWCGQCGAELEPDEIHCPACRPTYAPERNEPAEGEDSPQRRDALEALQVVDNALGTTRYQVFIDRIRRALSAGVPEAARQLIGNLVYALDTIVQEEDYYGERAAKHADGALLELRPQIDELDRALVQSEQGRVPEESVIDDIVDGYELWGEDEHGNEGRYTPSEHDRIMLKDFAVFLLSELDTRAAAPQPQDGESDE